MRLSKLKESRESVDLKGVTPSMIRAIPAVEQVVVGNGVIEVEKPPKHIPSVGKTWRCLDCGALLRLNGHHQGPRHGVVFVNGQPQYYRD
jgi:hypothetical protein